MIFFFWFECLLKLISFGGGIITNNVSVVIGGYVLLAAGQLIQLMGVSYLGTFMQTHFLEKG